MGRHARDDGKASWSISRAAGQQSMINMRLRDDTGREVFIRVKMSAPSIADLAQIMSDFGQTDQPAP